MSNLVRSARFWNNLDQVLESHTYNLRIFESKQNPKRPKQEGYLNRLRSSMPEGGKSYFL